VSGSPEKPVRTFYGWVIVAVAALAMAATLPGRTHGLGLITKRLLDDFPTLSQEDFGQINLWATLVGAIFCFPCGWLLDRVSMQWVVGGTLAALAAVVLWMAQITEVTPLVVAITLTRGLGQSMLSVISITMIGKWFGTHVRGAMAVYSVLMSIGMAIGVGLIGGRIEADGWRAGWSAVGWGLLVAAPLCLVLTRDKLQSRPRRLVAVSSDGPRPRVAALDGAPSATVWQALASPCFWVFALSISFFGLVTAGISLWQQFILEERGLSEDIYHRVLAIGFLVGMLANFAAGALSYFVRLSYLLAAAMLLLATTYGVLPLIETAEQAYGFAVAQGIAGGFLTVLFFAVWRHAYGSDHLGRIQGAAQALTVIASALGPLIMAQWRAASGNYGPILFAFAAIAAALGVAALWTPVPSAETGVWKPAPVPPPVNSPQESAA
jgi:MFS family permease